MFKIFIGLALAALIAFGIEHFLTPLPPPSLNTLRTIPISQLMLLFEAAVGITLLSGFVFQQLIHHCNELFRSNKTSMEGGARWFDLLFLLVAIFGSGVLYACFIKVFGS